MKNFDLLQKLKQRECSIHRSKLSVLLLALLLMLPAVRLHAQTIGSSADYPFLISTKNQLYTLAKEVNEGGVFYYNPSDSSYYDAEAEGYIAIANMAEGSFFKLTDDIKYIDADVASCAGVKPSGSGNYAWVMLGTETHPFDGNFDGDFHVISGLFVKNTTDANGFCGAIANHAVIKNLGVVNSYFEGANATGGIVGKALGGRVEKCFFIGTIQASGNYTGGLVGHMEAGTVISTSYASATIYSNGSQLGGIVGKVNNSDPACTIEHVYSSCILHGQFQYTGGIVGENINSSTVFTDCSYDKQLIDCKVTPNPTPGTAMETTDMTGTWAPTGFTAGGTGLYPSITLPSGVTLSQLSQDVVAFSQVPIFLPSGITLSDLSTVDEITVGSTTGMTWQEIERVGVGSFDPVALRLSVTGQSYVVLKAQKGDNSRSYVLQLDKAPYIGSESNPFPINNQTDLKNFRDGINNGIAFSYKHFTVPVLGENTSFIQTANIAMPSGDNISKSSNLAFKGTYDGGNYKITGLSSNNGFFGYTDNATVKNLTVERSSTSSVAAIIYSMAGGTVDNCHSAGSVTTKGGLIYETALGDYTCYIKNCTNRNNMSGASNAAGILCQSGSSNVEIDNCHNFGTISATAYVAGIVAHATNNATVKIVVTNCSNRGDINQTATGDCGVAAIVAHFGNYRSTTSNTNTCKVSHCFNTGKITGRCTSVAGIVASTGNLHEVSYCYNLGEIEVIYANYEPSVNGISLCGATKCFNAGKIINKNLTNTFAISNNANSICFNTGDLYSLNASVYGVHPAGSTAYTLGRMQATRTFVSGGYYDESRVPNVTNPGSGTMKTTTELASATAFSSTDWVCTDGYYPRIKGLDTLTISRVLSLPIYFADGDNVDNVTSTFTVRADTVWGIRWQIEGTSGASISAPNSNNLQTVTLNSNRTMGNIILAAHHTELDGTDSVYYRITLIQGFDAPTGTLLVENLADLQTLRDGINSGSSFIYHTLAVPAGAEGTTFKVANDFSMGGETNWTPIGDGEYVFKGTFDGNHKVISNLTQTGRYSGGLFGNVSGTVKNLTLSEVSIKTTEFVGAICTRLDGGVIDSCLVEGNITNCGRTIHSAGNTKAYVGGLVATSINGTISHSVNKANITTKDGTKVGGIVSHTIGSVTTIEYCENGGSISGTNTIAGISASKSKINYCVNYGNLTGVSLSGYNVGIGISSDIVGCVNSGHISIPKVSTTCYVAGIGYAGTVKESYNVGEIEGNNASATAGVAVASTTCSYSYNAARITGDNVNAVSNVTSSHCYYDTQMSISADTKGAVAVKTKELCSLTSSDLGDNFTYFVNSDTMYPRVKAIANTPASLATAAPVFLAETETVALVESNFKFGGCADNVSWATNDPNSHTITGCVVTLTNPGVSVDTAKFGTVAYKTVSINMKMDAYIIKNATELGNFRDGINNGAVFYYHPVNQVFSTTPETGYMSVPALGEGATFRLSDTLTSIDLGNIAWEPIGTSSTISFKGVFDGNNKTIENYTVKDQTNTGLFGYISNAKIHDLTIENANNSSISKQYSGALAGYSVSSTIENITLKNCELKSSNANVGGLMGFAKELTAKNISVSNVIISGTSYVGGVIGQLNGTNVKNVTVSNSSIKGTGSYVAGLIGYISTPNTHVYVSSINMIDNTVEGGSIVGGVIGTTSRGNGTQIINDIVVRGGSVKGTSSVAGVVAVMKNSQYNNLYCNATVSGTGNYVAGIVATGDGGMSGGTNWVFEGSVTGNNYVGGLFGARNFSDPMYDILISNSINAGSVKGQNYVGGIKGYACERANAASSCVNIGDVTGNQYVGGIVGYCLSTSTSNINAGRVTGIHYVGGIVGYQANTEGYSKVTSSSISVGQVYGTTNVGNVVGYCEDGTVANCFYDSIQSPNYKGIGASGTDVTGVAEGRKTADMLNTSLGMTGFTTAAGLYPIPSAIADSAAAKVAAAPVNLTDDKTAYTIPGENTYSFTPATANGVAWTSEGTALNNASGTFTPKAAGSDVLTATLNGVAKHVDITVGLSKEFPCIIKDQAQLTLFTQYINAGDTFLYNTSAAGTNPETFGPKSSLEYPLTQIIIYPGGEGAFFKLADDFNPNFQTETWEGPIGNSEHPFLGDFNGNNRTVSYLPSATSDNSGFFGVNKGSIYDLTIENPNMTAGEYSNVGALCGYNDNGTINNCHVINGTVTGGTNVGGLVGYNKGYVEDCHNSATVNATNNVGGITGNNTKTVNRCFNLGDITASATNNTNLGGVIGEGGNGTLNNCYNAGRIIATGSASKNVGGVVGNINSGGDINSCYNIGEVTAPTASTTGALAGTSGKTLVNTVAYDNQMCSVAGAYGSGNGNATSAATTSMLGTNLQSVLGNDGTWTYTDGIYPRLTSMKDMEASIASATPITLTGGETVANVEHEFTVGMLNSVKWSVEPATGVLDLTSNLPTVTFIRCGAPELAVKQGATGKEIKKINLSINYTASVVEYDTACGGDKFTWPVNGIDYYATNDVIYSTMENGCPVTYILHVTVPNELHAEVTPVDQKCYNTNTGSIEAIVTGGFGVYSYSWKDEGGNEVSTSNPATDLAPGTYSLTVTDGKPTPKNPGEEYCSVTVNNIVINPVTDLLTRIDTFSAGCYNAVDGMFQISVEGGVAPYTVSWDNNSRFLNTPQDNYEVNNLPDGNYTVMVTDANGCTKTEQFNMVENDTVYKITAFSGNKTYDGVAMEAGKFDLKIGSAGAVTYLSGNNINLTNGDVLTATVEQGSLTDAGEYSNSVASYSVTRNGVDVTCLYNIEIEHGLVSIAKRQVTLTSADSVAYIPITERCLTRHIVTVSGDGFVAADASEISYTYTGEVCEEAGIASNTFTVNWGNANSNNYDVTYNYGTLTLIELGKLVVKALSEERTYDGTTTTYGQNAYEIAAYAVIEDAGGPGVNDTIFYNTPNNTTIEVNGRTYTVTVVLNGGSSITMTNADTVDNVVTSVNVFDGNNQDITGTFKTVVTQNGVLQVNPIEITLTSYGDTWTYDAQPHSRPGVSVEGAFLSSDISVAPTANREETNAGKYTNTITYTTSGSFNARNYKIIKNEDTLVINQRPLYLTGIEVLVDVTGQLQQTTAFTYGNLITGHTASGISYLAEGTDIGNYPGAFSGTLHVEDASHNDVTSNYMAVEQPSYLGIQSLQGTIKMTSATKSQMYDGTAITAQTYEVTFKGVRLNPMAENDKYFKLSSGDTLVLIPTGDANSGWVDAGGPYDNTFRWDIIPADHKINYKDTSMVLGTVTVTKRPVTLTSNAFERDYDGTDIVSEGVTVSGSLFVDGQGASYTYENFTAGTRTDVGTYPNKFFYTLNTGTNADNYEIDTVYGKLIVNPAELIVTANNITRPYGDANVFTYTITGYQHGEDESVITAGLDAVTYLCEGDQFANIGTYTITPVVDALVSPNYRFTPATGTLTVQKRQLTVAANSVTVPYDGTLHNQTTDPTTITEYVNIATGDVADASLSYQRTAGGEQPMTVSGYTITRDGGARVVTNNYNVVASDTSKLIISKRDLKLVVTDTTKVYDGVALKATKYTVDPSTPLPVSDTISNVQYTGEQLTPGNSSSSIATGNLIITNTSTGQEVQGNSYNITIVNGNLTVTPAPLTIKLDTTKMYDGTAFVSDYTATTSGWTITGLLNGATIMAGAVTSSADTVATYIDSAATNVANISTDFVTSDNIAYYNVVYDFKQVIIKDTTKIVITSGNREFSYDGNAHSYPSYTVTYGGTSVDRMATDSTKFELPTGDVLSVTNPASITLYTENAPNNNTFSYTIENANNYDASAVSMVNGTIKINAVALPLEIASQGQTWTYDGNAHDYKHYTVKFDNVEITGTGIVNDTVFVLSTGDTLTITNAPSITDAGKVANTFTYTLQHDILYIGTRDTIIDTLRVNPLTGVEVTVKEHGGETTYDGYEQRVHGYDLVSISNSLYTAADFHYSGIEEDSIASGRYVGIYQMGILPTDFTNDNPNFDALIFTVQNDSLVIKPNPTAITITGGTAEKPFDGTPLTNDTYSYTSGVLAAGDTLVAVVEGTITNYGDSLNRVVEYHVYRDESRNSTMIRRGLRSMPSGYNKDVTDCYTFNTPEAGHLRITKNGNVVVTITGHTGGFDCDRTEHKVQGYEVSITDTLNIYTADDFSFAPSTDSIVTLATVGSDTMRLVGKFTNENINFDPVTFVVTNGWITVVDTTAPEYDKPADTVLYKNDLCKADTSTTVTGYPTGITDACTDNPTVTYRDEAQIVDCEGSYHFNRIWRVVDEQGNVSVSDSIQLITVKDTMRPTYTKPADTILYKNNTCVADTTTTSIGVPTALWDNCTAATNLVVTYRNDEFSSSCTGSYSFKRIWKVVDACGNVSVSDSVQVITVLDTMKPTYTKPADTTLYKNNTCVADTSTSSIGVPTALWDNCTEATDLVVTYRNDEFSSSCTGSYSFKRIWKVVDACGNVSVSDSVQVITVLDTMKPTFTKPADTTLYKNNTCVADTSTSSIGVPTALWDNCTEATDLVVTYRNDEFSSSCTGSYSFKRIWKVVDACGNISLSDSVQTITVLDTMRPTYTRPADTVLYKNDVCTADTLTTSIGAPTNLWDNCTVATDLVVTYRNDEFSSSCTGSYSFKRIWKVVDACGNISLSDSVQTITVLDTMRPTFTKPADTTLYKNDLCEADTTTTSIGVPTALWDNCTEATDLVVTYRNDEFSSSCTGSYSFKRIWKVVDACGNVSVSDSVQVITVLDTMKPTYTKPADTTLYKNNTCVADTTTTSIGVPTALWDNCTEATDLVVTYRNDEFSSSCTGSYSFKRIWKVVDACGNVSVSDSVQVITVLDTMRPTYTRPADTILYKNDVCYADTTTTSIGAPTALKDNCTAEADLVVTYRNDEFSSSCTGSYSFKRIWKVVDACGNISLSDSVQTITVLDTMRPTYTRPADTVLYKNDVCTADTLTTSIGAPTNLWDNCTEATDLVVTYRNDEFSSSCTGSYSFKRIWKVVDACGNVSVSDSVQVITVLDTMKPTFTKPADTTLYKNDLCEADTTTTSIGVPTALWDNCTEATDLVVTYRNDEFSSTCPSSYSFKRIWKVVDACGNVSVSDSVQVITVLDTMKPTFTRPDDITICRDAAGEIDASISVTGEPDAASFSDNCTDPSQLVVTFHDADTIGADNERRVIHRVWRVTDLCDKYSEQTQNIYVRPAISAAGNMDFTCPANIDTVIRHGGCNLKLAYIGVPVVDNHTTLNDDEFVITNNAPADSIYEVGETTVTWTITDSCGFSLTCDQIIKVSFQPCPDAVDYEDTVYHSVRLGSGCKCWTTTNLKSTKYSDGRQIEDVMDYYSYEYPNTNENVRIFGHLYNWYAAADTGRYGSVDSVERAYNMGHRIQGICPDGWYLPSDVEYEELNIYPSEDLRSTSYWIDGANNTNATGFNSLPGGKYSCTSGRYENIMGNAYYWTCHPVYDMATGAMIDYICEKIILSSDSRCSGYSIRCIYDEH